MEGPSHVSQNEVVEHSHKDASNVSITSAGGLADKNNEKGSKACARVRTPFGAEEPTANDVSCDSTGDEECLFQYAFEIVFDEDRAICI